LCRSTRSWKDYGLPLITEGNDERGQFRRLDARLLKLSTTSQLERSAKEAQDLNTALKFHPQVFGYIKIIKGHTALYY
jgi:hypothetical protein